MRRHETAVALARERGVDAAARERLERQRQDVNALIAQLQDAQGVVSSLADSVNDTVAVLQQTARQEDRSLAEFESVGARIGGAYEAGVFEQRGSERRITVFAFSGPSELTRLLAHELGHALYLPHAGDPTAIMSAFNQSGAIALSPADRLLLRERCSLYPGALIWLRERMEGRAEVME